MPIQVISRHDKDFDIHTHPIDPAKSPYARFRGYTQKIRALYQRLGIASALWASPEEQPFQYVQRCKQYEYVLRLDPCRVVAYVNEETWSDYILDKRGDYEYSTTPRRYAATSLIIPTPINANEVQLRREYRNTNGPDSFEIVEEQLFHAENSEDTEP